MKRTLLFKTIMAGLLLGLGTTWAVGGADGAEKVSLAGLKADLLRKMVAANPGDGALDKRLADLGGAKAVAGRLAYSFEGGKPSVVLDETKAGKDLDPAARASALAAVKDLLASSLNKVADGSITEGGKKLTLAKADAKALADSARILWRAAPPPADANKALVARLDALSKEIGAMKQLEARLAKAEKDAEKLGTLPAQIKALEGKAKASEDQAKALTERAAKLDKALADASATLEKQAKAGGALEKQVGEAKSALEKHGKETTAAMKKQADAVAALKKQADDTAAALEKQGKAGAALEKQLAEARAALEKQSKETTAALKKQGDDNAAALAKQKQETAAAFEKQGKAGATAFAKQAEANRAELKKVAEQVAAVQKKLAALEEKATKDAEWKKLEERLNRIEAILFPPPPPVVPCEVAEQGYYMMVTTRKHGCFGRLFPSTSVIWVPCPVNVP